MFIKDPYQFSTAGYRLAGMMVENQMRLMLALTDATFRGSNPFFNPPVSRRAPTDVSANVTSEAATTSNTDAKVTQSTKPPLARVARARVTPDDVKRKSPRRASKPPAPKVVETDLHPAE